MPILFGKLREGFGLRLRNRSIEAYPAKITNKPAKTAGFNDSAKKLPKKVPITR
jgi:hypothetical protein